MDWLKKFFSEPATILAVLSSGALGLVIGLLNGLVQKKHGGWPGFFNALATGITVALIVGLGITEYIKSEAVRLAIVGACAVISEDIWAGLKTIGRGLRDDPLGSIARIVDAVRGRPSTPKE